METKLMPKARKLPKLFFLLVVIIALGALQACSDSVNTSVLNPDQNAPTVADSSTTDTSNNNSSNTPTNNGSNTGTGETGSNIGTGGTDTGTGTNSGTGGTDTGTGSNSGTGGTDTGTGSNSGTGGTGSGTSSGTNISTVFSISEMPKNTDNTRPRYVAFSIATSNVGVRYDNYYLALKAANVTKPSAAEIKNGFHYQRNLNNNPLNIYAWAAVGTVYSTPNSTTAARAMMLNPSTEYILYGLANNGADADVTELKRFTTDALPVGGDIAIPVDSSIFNGPVFSVRTGEAIVLLGGAAVLADGKENPNPGSLAYLYNLGFDAQANLSIFSVGTSATLATTNYLFKTPLPPIVWWFRTRTGA